MTVEQVSPPRGAALTRDGWCEYEGCEWVALRGGWCSVHDPTPGARDDCREPGCGNSDYCRGMCKMHYRRVQRAEQAEREAVSA